MWYVNEYLIPSMLSQGIESEDISVWCDSKGLGNLKSCMNSFLSCKNKSGGTWHLQDDVLISKTFFTRANKHDDGIVCGFVSKDVGPDIDRDGWQLVKDMWFSFQCIRIPNDLASECGEWFYNYAVNDERFKERVAAGKSDDYLFMRFLKDNYPYESVLNLTPCLVEHVDYLLGGSIINAKRTKYHRAAFWDDQDLVIELEEKLNGGITKS